TVAGARERTRVHLGDSVRSGDRPEGIRGPRAGSESGDFTYGGRRREHITSSEIAMGAYVFDNSWEKERARLAGLESMLDPGTRRHLDAVGGSAGWTGLEGGRG